MWTRVLITSVQNTCVQMLKMGTTAWSRPIMLQWQETVFPSQQFSRHAARLLDEFTDPDLLRETSCSSTQNSQPIKTGESLLSVHPLLTVTLFLYTLRPTMSHIWRCIPLKMSIHSNPRSAEWPTLCKVTSQTHSSLRPLLCTCLYIHILRFP